MSAAPKPEKRPPKEKRPVKRQNVKRYTKDWPRIYGSKERVVFVKALPCIAENRANYCEPPVDNHHIISGGKSRKADARFIVPLCERHHLEMHRLGKMSFQIRYSVDLEKAAADTEKRWQLFQSGTEQ